MARRGRRSFDEEPENHDRWLISYADFITLLFAFFVVMYAISSINQSKYRVLSDALGDAFGGANPASNTGIVHPILPMPNPAIKRRAEAQRKEKEQMTKLATDLSSTLAPLVKEGKVRVTQSSRGVSVEINASVLFDPGDARLTGESSEALRAVAVLLREDTHQVQVEGHTDNQPIGNVLFPSNWELSAVRASSVVRLFIDAGVPAERLSAVGHSSNEPVASNNDPIGRARNRRVAVTILSGLTEAVTELPTPAPAP